MGVGIQSGYLVWSNGPFPAGTPDLHIFRKDLKNMLRKGERVEADKGYRGEPTKVDLPDENTGGLKLQHQSKQKVRARHETLNARLKEWGALNQKFRHKISKHRAVFRSIAVLTQLKIENGHPLFSVDYYTSSFKPIIVDDNDSERSSESSSEISSEEVEENISVGDFEI